MALILTPYIHFYNINPKTKQLHRKERLIQPFVFSGGGTLCVLRLIIMDNQNTICVKLYTRKNMAPRIPDFVFVVLESPIGSATVGITELSGFLT